MDKLIGALVVILIITVVLLLMLRSWRRRRARDSHLSGYPIPAKWTPTFEVDVLYVATTAGDNPVERLAITGLAFRSQARLELADEGVLLAPKGDEPVFIPAHAIIEVATASWAIDRGVEDGGLVVIGWLAREDNTGSVAVDSYIRARAVGDAVRIVQTITHRHGSRGPSRANAEGGA